MAACRRLLFIALWPGLSLVVLTACQSPEPLRYYARETTLKSYPDVLAELELAITERNFRLTGHNQIGKAIREREHRTFPDYDIFQFCNLTEARRLLEYSPAAINWMPCQIAVRTEGQRIIVTTPLLPAETENAKLNEFSAQMNQTLKAIVDYSVE